MRQRSRSVRHKLMTLIVGTSVLTLIGVLAFVISTDFVTFRQEMKDRSVLIAQVVGEYVIPELSFLDEDAAVRSLHKLRSVPAVESASLFDDRGELFASYGLGTTDSPPPGQLEEAVFFADGALHVVQPIVSNEEHYGTIYLQVGTAPLRRKIRAHLWSLGGVAVVLLIVSWLVARRLQRTVTEPILELAGTARRITLSGDYTVRVVKRAEDEIGVLCDGFNDMMDQILQRERERDEAELRTQEKSRFLANMSHELRTPLNSIIGFSEILQTRAEKRLAPKEQKFLRNIHGSGTHLLAIINDILDISKVEAGRMELHPEPVSVPALVEGVATVMKPVADRSEVQLRLKLDLTMPVVLADQVKLKQVMYNLIANAVKFSPPKREVLVETRSLDASDSPLGEDAVAIVVRDQGIGIEADEQARVFEAFHQADGTEARRYGGTGLGLALVRTFTEMHGGRVDLESLPGEGSAFKVILPVRGGLPPEREEGRSGHPVLIVEDHRPVAHEVSAVVAELGLEPVHAANGEAALEMTRRLEPTAVLLDLELGGSLSGWDVLREMKTGSDRLEVPVILFDRDGRQRVGTSLGADDYFVKPIDLDRLVRRVAELIDSAGAGRDALIVDDDPTTHDLLARLLADVGVGSTHAYSVKEALGRVSTSVPGVVVIDLLLGDFEGFRVARELRNRSLTAGVPIVMLTNQELSAETKQRLLEVGRERPEIGLSGASGLSRALRSLLERHPTHGPE